MLFYQEYIHKESKEWVTFIHGAGGSSSIWYKQIREFSKHFNVLLLDLRGHGNSKNDNNKIWNNKYTFEAVAIDVVKVMEHLKLTKSHFVGISLGSIIIRQISEMYPNKVKSMILGGAILKMNFRSQLLMWFGNVFKYIMPYLLLYKLFAFIIMPKENHKHSRLLFVNEAKKLCQREFIKWFKLTSQINPLLKYFRLVEINIPTLYIMGDQDYMFLPVVQKVVKSHKKSAQLHVINQCGHVVNVEQPVEFNNSVINFIKKLVLK